jgi:hypothetical protein
MKKDLHLAFHWFTHPNEQPQSFLTSEGIQLVDEIQVALSTHAIDNATRIARHLFFVSNLDRREVGEILLRTAIYAVLLKEEAYLLFAKEQVQRAAETFVNRDLHSRAFALWFVGYISWQIPMGQREAIRQWDQCRYLLNLLSYSHVSPAPDWYQKVRFLIVEAFFNTRMREQYYPLKDVRHTRLRPSPQPSIPTAPPTKPKAPPSRLIIRTIPVYQYVPAGGWGVVDPDEVGHLEVEKLMMEGKPYQAIDLVGRGRVTLRENEPYAVVHIKGTSMNKLNIEDGDYVVIHRQEDASHMDVVLAERITLDSEATLKRYYKQGRILELHPESDDPSHPILPVEKRDDLRILGIAIAVLKPLPPEHE